MDALAGRSFGSPASLSVRAPGRVNLIGDHIDYCDLAVLPMAIGRDVRIDFRPREDGRVRVVNTNPAHGAAEFSVGVEIPAAGRGEWSNYVRAAVQHLARKHGLSRGFDAVVDGNVPEAAGLSSSSALVVASALATLASNAREIERLELAEDCAEAERYVGTNSGGMDQAASLLAIEGHALRVDFAPLRTEAILVPTDWRFSIANSLGVADKSGALRESYNGRRAASEAALAALAARHSEIDARLGYPALMARYSVEKLLELASAAMEGELLRRFRHVVTESGRVERACSDMSRGDIASFGDLMNASHQSLRDDCEVSTPDIERLVEIAREHGARGARLTGAGLGGAVVALIEESREEGMLEAFAEKFFAERIPARELRRHLLRVSPSGAQ